MLPKLKRETGSFQDMLHLRIPTKKSLSDQEDKDDSSSPRSPSDGATVTQHVQKNTGNVKKKRHSGLHYFFHSHSHQHHKESKFFIEDMDSQEKRKSLTLSDPLHNRKVTSPTSSLTSLQSKRPKWHLRLHPPSAPHISHRRRKSISGIVEPPEPPPQLVPYTPVHAASAIQKLAPPVQRISRRAASEDGTAAVGLVDGPDLKVENATTDVLRSVSEQNALLNALPSERILRRRASCPALERPIEHLKKHTPKCQRILSIADVQHRSQISGDTLLKRTSPSGSPGTSSPTSPQHRQTHTHPQPSKSLHERASKLYPLPHPRRCNSTGRVSNVTVSRQSSEDSGSNGSTKTSPATKIPNVIDPVTGREVIRFSDIQPRSVRLRRRVSEKKEAKALNKWRATVQAALDEHAALLEKQQLMPPKTTIPPEKKHKYALTRRFILREFYTTEVTFWNQLYYSKVASIIILHLRHLKCPLLTKLHRCFTMHSLPRCRDVQPMSKRQMPTCLPTCSICFNSPPSFSTDCNASSLSASFWINPFV